MAGFLESRHDVLATFSLRNLGHYLWLAGDPDNAAYTWESALQMARLSGNRALHAETEMQAGYFHYYLGRHEASLTRHEQALALYLVLEDRAGEANALDNMAINYCVMGRLDAARLQLTKAAAIWRSLGHNKELVANRVWFGWTFSLERNFSRALEEINKALSLALSTGNPQKEVSARDRLGSVLREKGDFPQALKQYERVMVLVAADREQTAHVLLNMADTYCQAGQPKKAVDLCRQALKTFSELAETHAVVHASYVLAQAYRNLKQWDPALAAMEMMLRQLETARTGLTVAAMGRSFSHSRDFYFEFAVDLLWETHLLYPDRGLDQLAFETTEQNRARNLRARLEKPMTSSTGPDQRKRLDRILALLDDKAFRRMALPTSETLGMENEIRSLILEMERLTRKPFQGGSAKPELPNASSTELVVEKLLDGNTLLLSYELGEKRSFVWALDGKRFSMHELPGRAAIEQRVKELYTLLGNREEERGQFQLKAFWLSEHLLGPVWKDVTAKRFWLIKDEVLHYLPFSVLPPPEGEGYLISDHDIVGLPSATYGVRLRKTLAQRTLAPEMIAVFADPIFRERDERMGPLAHSPTPGYPPHLRRSLAELQVEDLGRLHYSGSEATAILDMIPDRHRKMAAIGFEATRDKLLNTDLSCYRILHFSTHGLLHPNHQELSGIVLSLYDTNGNLQDGFVRSYHFDNRDLPVELVTLSACRTALGDNLRGEGMWSFGRTLMGAGAARILASLWKVEDRPTAQLMQNFYTGLLVQGLDSASALAEAQRQMLHHEEYRQPYFWAAFELHGEWREFLP